MRKRGLLIPLVLLLGIAAFFVLSRQDFLGLPIEIQAALAEPDSVEMIYVDPMTRAGSGRPGIGGRDIVERVPIPKADRRLAIDWLRSLLPQNRAASPAGCFFPRHVLRVKKGEKVYDFLVCVSCGGTHVYRGSGRVATLVTVSGDPPEKRMPYLPRHPLGDF
ncbi:hypothetical protein EON79_00230 [bacterium]|nr:MAG: hypothetical protein EON79_00230 [bacterium]